MEFVLEEKDNIEEYDDTENLDNNVEQAPDIREKDVEDEEFKNSSSSSSSSTTAITTISPNLTISNNGSEVFCVRFSPDGDYLACGCGDGGIRVFNSSDGRLAYSLKNGSTGWLVEKIENI